MIGTMDKEHKVVSPEELQSSQLYLTTDWSKCALGQEHTSEVLRCPADSKRDSQGAGYMTMAGLLEGFDNVGCLPRKRRAHQIAISSLYLLLKKAYNQYSNCLGLLH